MFSRPAWMFFPSLALRACVLSLALQACAGLSTARAEPPLKRFAFDEPHMGTRFRILLYAADEETARNASRAAFDRIAALDACMSDYKADSELTNLCRKAGGEPVAVSDELFFVLSRAQETARLSGGAFDVTVGPVVRLWRRARRTQQMPDPEKLAQARSLVGYTNVRLDARGHTVQLLKAGMQLDLGGIAKGYAADEAQAVLKKHGITRALVAAGGDIVVSRPPPGAEGWKIAIAPLLDAGEAPGGPWMWLKDGAVSTSGDAEQFVVIDGKRYSHIVDPRTGIGLVGRMSATVTARDGITADSLTKVVAVLGPDKGFPIVESVEGAAARFVRGTGDGLQRSVSKGFPPLHEPEKHP
jgi:thiamine biosynthesis lipoprotein